jgi:hypothetical protein
MPAPLNAQHPTGSDMSCGKPMHTRTYTWRLSWLQGSGLPPLDTLTSIQEQEAMQALCEMGSRPASQGTPAVPITLEQTA